MPAELNDQRHTVKINPEDKSTAYLVRPGAQGPPGTLATDVDYIQFALDYADGTAEGKMSWNSDDGTLDLGLPGGNVKLQIGEEHLVRVKNASGSSIPNGSVVYLSGATGHRPEVALADASDSAKSDSIAIATETIANNATGYCSIGSGLVRDIDTSAFSTLDAVYLSATAPGALTATVPAAPNRHHLVGYVIYSHVTEGSIYFFSRQRPNIDELSDVSGTPTDGQALLYTASTGVWEPGDSGSSDPVLAKVPDVSVLANSPSIWYPEESDANQATLEVAGYQRLGSATNPATFQILDGALQVDVPAAHATSVNPGVRFPMAVNASTDFDVVFVVEPNIELLAPVGAGEGRSFGVSVGIGDTGADFYVAEYTYFAAASTARLYYANAGGSLAAGTIGGFSNTTVPDTQTIFRLARYSGTTLAYMAMMPNAVGGWTQARRGAFSGFDGDGWYKAGTLAYSGAITHACFGVRHNNAEQQRARLRAVWRLA